LEKLSAKMSKTNQRLEIKVEERTFVLTKVNVTLLADVTERQRIEYELAEIRDAAFESLRLESVLRCGSRTATITAANTTDPRSPVATQVVPRFNLLRALSALVKGTARAKSFGPLIRPDGCGLVCSFALSLSAPGLIIRKDDGGNHG
jgi:hypothetical protein